MKVLDSAGARRYWPVAAVIGIGLLFTRTVTSSGQAWTTASVSLAGAHPGAVPANAWGALLVGFLMTALAGLYLYASARRRAYDRAAAETKTALQESEQRFRTIYDAVNEGIFLVDPATDQFVD